MRGDAVGAGLDRQQRGTHRIGPRASPRVAKGRDVIDVNSETQRRNGHGKSSPDEEGLHFGHRSRRRKSAVERTATHSWELVPTFRSSCTIAAPTFTNFGK